MLEFGVVLNHSFGTRTVAVDVFTRAVVVLVVVVSGRKLVTAGVSAGTFVSAVDVLP